MTGDWVESLHAWLESIGLTPFWADALIETLQVALVAIAAAIANTIVKRILLGAVDRFAERTKTDWDNILVRRRVFHRFSHFAPAVVIYILAPAAFQTDWLIVWAQRGAQVYMLIVGLLVIDAALNAGDDIYQRFDVSRRVPILGYLQVVKLVLSLAALITCVSILIDKSPLLLLSGLGAMTAVLLLIFKDSILGFVAGIQIVANDMVRPGDWIEMPKYGADGDVEQITLNVVKVRNWDKTVTTVPTYALISDSFKNWRGMTESGGRRIKRSISIDVNTIHFCSPELIAELEKITKLKPYIDKRREEIDAYNREYGHIDDSPANGRRMTNIGMFRAYAIAYLQQHSQIFADGSMTFLVRQLQPTAQGLPIEIYVFSRDQRWVYYEGIQADIFDHLFAVMPLFELKPFQEPSGGDWREGLAALASSREESALQQGSAGQSS